MKWHTQVRRTSDYFMKHVIFKFGENDRRNKQFTCEQCNKTLSSKAKG